MGKLVRYQLLNVVKYVDNAVKAKKLEALGYEKAPEPKEEEPKEEKKSTKKGE